MPQKTAAKKTTRKRAPKNGAALPKIKDPRGVKVDRDREGFPYLKSDQLMKWRMTQAEALAAKNEHKLRQKERLIWLQGQPEYRQLLAAEESALNEHRTRLEAYHQAMEEIEAELGFSISRQIINEDSGRITFVDDKGRPDDCAEIPAHLLLRNKKTTKRGVRNG